MKKYLILLIPLMMYNTLGAMKKDSARKKDNSAYCISTEELMIRVLNHKLEHLPEGLKTKIMKLLKPPFSNAQ